VPRDSPHPLFLTDLDLGDVDDELRLHVSWRFRSM
jgi:hypothetical protein